MTRDDLERQDSTARTVGHDRSRPRVHPLHVGLDRGAEGRDALASERAGVRPVGSRDVRRWADDRLSSHAPLHFDLSVFDLFAAAMAGAAVVLVPARASVFPVQVRDFIENRHITIWYSVPSILSMLILRGGLRVGSLPDLRTVLFAGEVFPTKYLRSADGAAAASARSTISTDRPRPTCAPGTSVPPLPDDATEPIPIGNAIDDVEVFAIGEDGALAGRRRGRGAATSAAPR